MSYDEDDKTHREWGTPPPNSAGSSETSPSQAEPPTPETPETPIPPVAQQPPASGWQPPPPPGWAQNAGWPPPPQGWQPPPPPGWAQNAGWPPQPQGWQPPPPPGWAQNAGWPPQPQGWQPPPHPGWQPGQPSQGWPTNPPRPMSGDVPSLRRRSSRLSQILVVVALCLITFSGGMVFNQVAFTQSTNANPRSNIASGSNGQLQNFDLYNQALGVVRSNYVGRSSVTDKQLLYGSIKGMVESLGDTGHTVFLTPEQYTAFMSSLNAQIAGIGILISNSGQLKVVRVIAGSPAETSGIKAGDQITAVDGTSTAGWTFDQLSAKIRGTAGTKVTLTVIHLGSTSPADITLTRAVISVPMVAWGLVPGTKIADIALTEFADGASNQLKVAIDAATKAGATAIILDLRGNPGGYAAQAQAVASQFLASGTIYITEDAEGKRTEIKVDTSQAHSKLPMVVLVDHDSASSAEIVAGALQDSGRAKIVGASTFGTGTVLQKFMLSDGSAIFLGVEYWLTPSGHKIFGVGITPDEKATMPANVFPTDPSDLTSMTTTQLASSGDAELLAAVKDLSK